MKKLTAVFLCAALLFCSGCGGIKKVPKQTRYQAEFLSLFDTITSLVGYAESKDDFTEASNQFRDKLEEYHKLYTIYEDFEGINNIKTINDMAGIEPVKVDRRIIELLEYYKEQYKLSRGTFNIALGSVLEIWHEYRETGINNPEEAQLPPMELLKKAAEHTNIDDIIIDVEASTVYLKDPLMRLDVGAVAKGYAVERVAEYMLELGIENLLISVGGNVRAIGGKLEGKGETSPWVVGIKNPDSNSRQAQLMSVSVKDLSVVSSGIYERYYTVDGRQYHHIIDPETLMPSEHYAQVTIICQDSGLADALSTAAFIMPIDEAKSFINSMDGVEACWVLKSGEQIYSEGFEQAVPSF